ncbi:hypothetical protein P8605_11940, partial [Streptomyces sp. T-3]|nr:hypothetical protein [Streptomyces sp. T-3]
MAGETPDRSEQRSPGEAAEAAADPRLAVAKERPVRVDQPTAVFSVAGAAQGRGEEASAPSRSGEEASSGSDEEASAPSGAGDEDVAGAPDAPEPARA